MKESDTSGAEGVGARVGALVEARMGGRVGGRRVSAMARPRGMWAAAWLPGVLVWLSVMVYSSVMFAVMMPASTWIMAASVAGGLFLVGAPAVIAVGSRRYRLARARAHWYRLCPGCGEDLRLCPEARACPGCGRGCSPEALLKEWEKTDAKSAAAKRWRPLTARGVLSPVFLMVVLPPGAGLLAAWFLVSTGVLPRSMAMMAFIVIGPMMGAFGTLVMKRDRRDYEAIEKGGFLSCPECIAALPEPSGGSVACCYGCGQEYTRAWLEQTWTGSYAHVVGVDGKGKAAGRFGIDRGSQRLAMWFGAIVLIVVAVLVLLSPVVGFASLRPAVIGAVGAVLVVGVLVFTVLLVRRSGYHHTRMIRLRAHGYRFCPECGYDLRELAPEGACPECGVGYDGESLRTRWERGARVEPPAL